MFDKAKSKAEDIFFAIILALPEKLIPMNFMEKYLDKRAAELKSECVKGQWNIVGLEKELKHLKEADHQ